MKTKVLQRLSTIIAVILVIPLTIISIIASVANATKENENENEQQPIDEPKTSQNKIVNGIYRFEGELTLSNITYFVEDNELFTYFETQDINGVNNAALNMGYSTFAKNITTDNNKEKYIEFASENKATSYTKDGNEYTVLNETEFEFTYSEAEAQYVSTGLNPIIKANEENKTVTLYFPFYIENDDGTVEITPLYVEAKLVYVEKSK